MDIHAFAVDLEENYKLNQDPKRAQKMKAYMKNRYDFYGIPSPKRSIILKELLKSHKVGSIDDLVVLTEILWKKPQREFQYVAMDLLGKREKHLNQSHLNSIEHFICTKSWWDTVDWLAGHAIGNIFRTNQELIQAAKDSWMKTNNIWLQRTLLLFQLFYKEDTDKVLLGELIQELKTHQDFFIRKAIGWALRQYSKNNREWVINYVKKNADLSPLSKKEALKWLNKNKT